MKTFDKICLFVLKLKLLIQYVVMTIIHGLLPWIFKKYPVNTAIPMNAILITGCSTGIGKHAAFHLAQKGFTVFTGVRKLEDAKLLKEEFSRSYSVASPNGRIVPVIIDVTSDSSVEKAADFVKNYLESNDGYRLVGIVNNAGIGYAGPIEILPKSKIENVLKTNYFGPIKVVQEFLPILRSRSRGGRVLNISSFVADVPMGCNGLYSSSKAAIQAVTVALRQELSPLGISVSCIQPGAFRTEIFKKTVESKKVGVSELSQKTMDIYSKYYDWSMKSDVYLVQEMDRTAGDPSLTSLTIEHALTSAFPQSNYLVGLDALVYIFFYNLLPSSIFDYTVLQIMKYANSK